MLESSSIFKMNSNVALEKTIVLLTRSIQILSDSHCSQIDNSFWINPKCASQKRQWQGTKTPSWNKMFSVMDGRLILYAVLLHFPSSCNLWAELNTVSSRDLLCTCPASTFSSRSAVVSVHEPLLCSLLFRSECVSFVYLAVRCGSVTVSLSLASNTLTLSFYPK